MKRGPGGTKSLKKVLTIKGRKFLFLVEDSEAAADYLKYEELREAIWRFPQDNLPGGRNMMCGNILYEGGSLLIGAFAADEGGGLTRSAQSLVGFSYGFIGVRDKAVGFRRPQNLRFYSQYLGVREEFRSYGLGVLLKEFQREKVLSLFGATVMTCTFDPLTAVNASRNIRYFGMSVEAYRHDICADFGGLLNRLDIPRDRFFVAWDLSARAQRRAAGAASPPAEAPLVTRVERAVVNGRGGPLELEKIAGVNLRLKAPTLLVQIPQDFYLLLGETDVEDPEVRRIPLDWRLETRRAFRHYLARGYRVADFFQTREPPKKFFYALRKD